MDQYKISQNPNAKAKKARKSKVVAPKRKDARTLNPQTAMAVAVIVLGLVLATVFALRNARQAAPAKGGAAATSKGADAQGAVPAEALTDVTTALNNKNAAGLTAHYAKKVHVVIVGKKVNQNVGAQQAQGLVTDPLNNAQTPWNWHVSAGDLAAWQTGPYGQYFTGNIIVGISPDGTVISVHFDDNGKIDTVFVAPVGDLTTPTSSNPASPGAGSADSTTPTSTTPTPVEPEKTD